MRQVGHEPIGRSLAAAAGGAPAGARCGRRGS
uniref:Uncharacterized protein n=1 Tax=Arundo donax TaxID=35708 RepID=A0A0A9AGL0_ARUDO